MVDSKIDMLVKSANGFFKAGREVAEKIHQEMAYNTCWEIVPVAIMNLNFSAELFLKFILYISNKESEFYGHELKVLFERLPDSVKSEIQNEYDLLRKKDLEYPIIKLSYGTFKDNPDDLIVNDIMNLNVAKLLDIHSRAFIEWRYSYEKVGGKSYLEYNFDLMINFIQSIKNVFYRNGVLTELNKTTP
ncbi:hypothetical protein [Chryseobacterium gleum]|uniref:hypothetical protein n=1 Tax=Chryseobacterium gleum TaxID=250 RepID=UPI002896D34D|nr:hypothetical protein [Chryseobacterium gleum]